MSPVCGPEAAETLVWEGVAMTVTYEPDWGGMSELGPKHQVAHIVLEVLEPVGAPIPVTDTGYRSEFCRPEEIEAAGGPMAFVRAWLDQESCSKAWRKRLAAWRQLDLFG